MRLIYSYHFKGDGKQRSIWLNGSFLWCLNNVIKYKRTPQNVGHYYSGAGTDNKKVGVG